MPCQRMATKSCMLVCLDAVTPMFSGVWLPSPISPRLNGPNGVGGGEDTRGGGVHYTRTEKTRTMSGAGPVVIQRYN